MKIIVDNFINCYNGGMYRLLFTLFFLPALVFADVKIIDSRGLTRASLSDAESTKVEVIFKADIPQKLSLSSDDGLNRVVDGQIQGQKAIFLNVSSGVWRVDSKNLKYQVKIHKN